MKSIASIVVLTVALAITVECQAQKPDREGKGAREGQRQGPGDPSEMATRMMKEFDKDGDNKLDTKELIALFTSMRERRARGGEGRRGQGRPGTGEGRPRGDGEARPQRGEGAEGKGRREGKGGRGGEGEKSFDGVKPERPDFD